MARRHVTDRRNICRRNGAAAPFRLFASIASIDDIDAIDAIADIADIDAIADIADIADIAATADFAMTTDIAAMLSSLTSRPPSGMQRADLSTAIDQRHDQRYRPTPRP
ncbi:hypothetical protein K7G19_16290 [Cupriavidus sp. DB3]|uniref:hypothetical protein n=1 Tax=Cupriavidus sp. DB3 TaxID=2873259 RepID=UPI001CF0E53E|nr:hypothetical protein [Cupriavidus sp. DB3]MCA7085156.1 hypothetical protein [Cupriavidus sp. DB3]